MVAPAPPAPDLPASRLDAVVRSLLHTSGLPGEEALLALVAELGSMLDARHVHVSVPCPDRPDYFRTLAVWPPAPPATFRTTHTATGSLWIDKREICAWENIDKLFPESRAHLDKWRAASLLGQRLHDFSGAPLGVLVVLLGPDPRDRGFAETVMRLCALRAVGELIRTHHEAQKIATERRRAATHAAVAAQETRFQDVFSHTEDSVFFLRAESRDRFVFERVNSRFTSALDSPASAIVGRTPREIFPADAAQRLLDHCRTCVQTRAPLTFEQHLALPSGARVYRTRIMPVLDANGDIFRLIGFATDISDLHQQQNLLAETEAITRVGGWDFDATTRRLLWTAGTHRIYERAAAAFTPDLESVINLHQEDYRDSMRSAFQRAIARGVDFDLTTRAELPSGRVITIHTLGQTEKVDGRVVRVFGAVRDITADEEADQLRLRLEAQLRGAQKMEAVGTLAGGIAHDFNNILTGIMGSIQLAGIELPPGSKLQRFLDQSYQGCTRARDLVRRMLTFSRQAEQTRAVSALRPIIEEAIELLRASIPANVVIESRFADEALHALVDPGQIHQIVLNLGVNAAHAMRPKGGILAIELGAIPKANPWLGHHPQVKPSHRIQLTVRDTGCGISAETLERIFEPFFSTKAPGEGSGLGLAMVHGIVDNHGGAIVVESTEGAGTAFHLFFPGQIRRNYANNPALAIASVSPLGEGQRILVVDDEEIITTLAQPILRHLGYEPCVFNDPCLALASFSTYPDAYAAVLTDLTMPGLDGIAFARAIRALKPEIPILLMTGHLKPADIEVMRAVGIANHLPKPFSVHTLALRLSELIPRATAA